MDWREERNQEAVYGKGWKTVTDKQGFEYTFNEDYINKYMGGGENIKNTYEFIFIDFGKLLK